MHLREHVCVFQCSVSCGVGYQQRIVSCTAVPSAPNLQVFGAQSYTQVLPSKCPQPPPPNTQPCQLPLCPLSVYWKAGPWSKVCECVCVFNLVVLHISVLSLHANSMVEVFGVLKYAFIAILFSILISQYSFFCFAFFSVFSDMW